jgi:hypothetical protein
LAGHANPDAVTVEGSAGSEFQGYDPAIKPTDSGGVCAVVAKSAGHAICQHRRDRASPVPVPDEGRRASADETVQEFVMQSASQRRRILGVAISRCQFDGWPSAAIKTYKM